MGTAPLHRVAPERLLHRHGEALLRRDFADQTDQDNQLRWWHNRALHGAYGVCEGLTVSALSPGSRASVGRGVAFDAFGRELILEADHTVTVPETNAEYLLCLSYDRPPLECGERSNGFCQDEVFAQAGVRLQWVRRARFTLTDGAPLAVLNERAECADRWLPPRVRSQARPKVGHGLVVVRDEFDLDPWEEKIFGRPFPVGAQVVINTSAAGFTGAPCYFVELTVDPPDPVSIPLLTVMARNHIHAPTADQFTLRFLSPSRFSSPGVALRSTGTHDAGTTRFSRRGAAVRGRPPTELRISWIGVQHRHQFEQHDEPKRHGRDGGGDELHQ
jgi:hypothetical protein